MNSFLLLLRYSSGGERGLLVSKETSSLKELQSAACALRRHKLAGYFTSASGSTLTARLCLCCGNGAIACDSHLLLCRSEPWGKSLMYFAPWDSLGVASQKLL